MESWNQTSTDEVRSHAPTEVNKRIDERVERCVRHMAQQERPEISRYLEKLEREWDLNRAVMVVGSLVSVVGLWLGRRDGSRWRILGGMAAGTAGRAGARGGRRAHAQGDRSGEVRPQGAARRLRADPEE
jgi:hypothetical protein